MQSAAASAANEFGSKSVIKAKDKFQIKTKSAGVPAPNCCDSYKSPSIRLGEEKTYLPRLGPLEFLLFGGVCGSS